MGAAKSGAVLAVLLTLITVILGAAPAQAVGLDGTCVATVTFSFIPPATQPLPPAPGPYSSSTGSGIITGCVMLAAGATTGTFTYALQGNLTCTSAQNVTGTLDIAWADASTSHATVTGLTNLGSVGGTAGLTADITSGRFDGDQIAIANLRDPLALLTCLTTGLAQASGTTSLTLIDPT